MRKEVKLAIALAAVALLALICAGCGVTTGTAGKPQADASTTANAKRTAAVMTTTTGLTSEAAAQALTKRSPDDLIMDGSSEGTVAHAAYRRYRRQGGTESLAVEDDAPATAFRRLCSGTVDLVNSTSEMSSAQVAFCQREGVTPVQIQLGSVALVLATENETDVGADCLTVPQVKTILRSGSPVTNWEQLQFDDSPLSVAGPSPSDASFQYLGDLLVGSSNPSLTDLRDNYRALKAQDGVRKFIIGSQAAGEQASDLLPERLGEVRTAQALIRGQEDVVRGAKRWLRSAERYDHFTQITQATDKLDRANSELAQLRPRLAHYRALMKTEQATRRKGEATIGRLGIFQYGYYALYEQDLRPLEISQSASPENCVFPSTQSISSGDYPLSGRMLLTFSKQELQSNSGLRQFLVSYLENINTISASNELVALPVDEYNKELAYLRGTTTTQTTSTPQPQPIPGEMNSMSGTGANASTTTTGATSTSSESQFGQSSPSTSGTSTLAIPQGAH